MTKSYEFNWQKHLPEFMQEGTSFDRFDEVMRSKLLEERKRNRSTLKHVNQADLEDALTHKVISM